LRALVAGAACAAAATASWQLLPASSDSLFVPTPSVLNTDGLTRQQASAAQSPLRPSPAAVGATSFARLATCLGALCAVASFSSKGPARSTARVVRQALQETGSVKLNLQAGKATPAPPVGPAIGALGINIAMFVKEYNALTANKEGVVPVVVRVFNDRSFNLELKAPPTSELLLQAAGADKGAAKPLQEIVGTITIDQLKEIAETKLPELNVEDATRAMKIIHGTAKTVGVNIEGYDEWVATSTFAPPKNILSRYGATATNLPEIGEAAAEEPAPEEVVEA